MAAVSRAKRIKAANKLGLSLRGYDFYRGGGSLGLAEMSPRGIRSQAQKEIASSYKPITSELNRRDSQIKALDAKRASDEQAFNTWMGQQQARILSEAETRDATLRQVSAQHHAATQQRLDTIMGPAPAPGQPTTNQAAARAAVGSIEAQSAGAVQGITDQTQLGGNLRDAVAANNVAFAKSLDARRVADTQEAYAKNADARNKALLQRAADNNKRVAQLLQGETQKAQIRIAAQQFGIKESNDVAADRARVAATRRGQTLSATERARDRAQRASDNAAARQNARWLKQHDKTAGGKKKGQIKPGQKARAQLELEAAMQRVQNDPHFQIGRGQPKTKKGGFAVPGSGKRLADKLMRNGVSADIAQIAAFKLIYPNAKLTKNLRDIWLNAQLRQSNPGG